MSVIDSYVEQYGGDLVNALVGSLGSAVQFVVVLILGYIFAYLISHVVKKLLSLGELQRSIVRYGAMTSKMWLSIVEFITQYLKWYLTIAILTTTDLAIVNTVFYFLSDFFWFIILVVIGLFIGGIAFKIMHDGLQNLGLEEEMHRHKITNAFGGITLSSILAGIVKWYIVLVFVNTGVEQVLPQDSVTGNTPALTTFMNDLMAYIPQAILGLLILLVSLIISSFVVQRIKERHTAFSQVLSIGAEAVIIFFGIVLALPKFGVENVEILEDSFKIISAGVAVGLAIALGWGLKEPIAKAGSKHLH